MRLVTARCRKTACVPADGRASLRSRRRPSAEPIGSAGGDRHPSTWSAKRRCGAPFWLQRDDYFIRGVFSDIGHSLQAGLVAADRLRHAKRFAPAEELTETRWMSGPRYYAPAHSPRDWATVASRALSQVVRLRAAVSWQRGKPCALP
jgi:hypothetical protein